MKITITKDGMHGFFLVECIVYLLLTSLLSFMIFVWANRINILVTSQTKQLNHLISKDIALNFLLRDLSNAPAIKESWKKLSNNHIIWKVNGNDVGWYIDQGKLLRISGTYIQKNGTWHDKVTSLVAQDCPKITFSFHEDKDLINKIIIKYGSETYNAVLNNGIL